MQKRGRALLFLLCILISLSGCTGSDIQKKSSDQSGSLLQPISSEPGWKIIQSAEGNLYGDKTPERFQLAERDNGDRSQQPRWQIWINEKMMVELDNQQGFYDYAKFSLENIDQDAYEELLVFRINGGSGAGSGLCIYKVQNSELITMLDTDPGFEDQNDFTVRYMGNYQVSFNAEKIGLNAVIYLNPENYNGMESELSKINTWVDPIAEYEIKDLDHDGKKEVICIRRVIGISHPDTIAKLKIIYKLQDSKYADFVSYLLTDAEGNVITGKTS